MPLPNKVMCMVQYKLTDVKVASYGIGMCQNHNVRKKIAVLAHSGHDLPASSVRGSPIAINGAARRIRTMCWPTRAENSATDSAQSGDKSAADATSQPLIAQSRY